VSCANTNSSGDEIANVNCEKNTWCSPCLKRCSTTLEITIEFVIEIGMEQTPLFHCIVFHYVDRYFRDWNRDWFFSDRATLVLKNSDWNRQGSIVERTRLFQCTLFHYNEKSAKAKPQWNNVCRFQWRFQAQWDTPTYKNSSGDEIANVNFYAVRAEATRIRWNNA